MQADKEELHDALVRLAERLLAVRPFAPDALDNHWIDVLGEWIGGAPLSTIGSEYVGLIEGCIHISACLGAGSDAGPANVARLDASTGNHSWCRGSVC